jgi:hypothetical protein
LFAVLAFVCCRGDAAAADKTKFTKHFNESLFNITDKGLFSVEILMDDKEYDKLGKEVTGLVIHNQQDADVEGAEIKITSVMSEGQTDADAPVVKDKGEGLYTVSGLNVKKEGKWELKISVKKKKLEDSASFNFPDVLKTPMKKGKYSAD